MIFGKQWLFCQGCGQPFQSTFGEYDGRVCSPSCWDVLERKRTHAIMGKHDEGPSPFERLREELAALEHVQWAHWTRYMLETLALKALIVGRLPEVTRWLKQCETPYSRLTEKEKDSDREWADRALKLLGWVDF
jgi:hypothetical protein